MPAGDGGCTRIVCGTEGAMITVYRSTPQGVAQISEPADGA